MSVNISSTNWLQRCGGPAENQPLFKAFHPAAMEPEDLPLLATTLRQAFAFFRRHGDRRYSPGSLMKILNYADYLDQVVAGQIQYLPSNCAGVVVAESDFTYDEETEVKSGGVQGFAILLPDNRLMVAVHQDKRRVRLGTGLLRFAESYLSSNPEVWVHRNNHTGAQFVLSVGMSPWMINGSGAVQYSAGQPSVEDSGAVEYADDVEDLLRMQRPRRRNRITSPIFATAPPVVEDNVVIRYNTPQPVRYDAFEQASEDLSRYVTRRGNNS